MGLKQDQIKLIELDTRDDGEAIQDALLELTGGRSVPRVFIDGQFIGGGDDTDVRRVGSIGRDWQRGVIVIENVCGFLPAGLGCEQAVADPAPTIKL